MPRMRHVHTNMRVRDIDASLRFYEALGYERRGRLQFEGAYNVYLGLPGDGDTLELTVNEDRTEPYDLGERLRAHRAVRGGPRRPARRGWPRPGSSRRSRRTTRAGARSSASASCRIRTGIASS